MAPTDWGPLARWRDHVHEVVVRCADPGAADTLLDLRTEEGVFLSALAPLVGSAVGLAPDDDALARAAARLAPFPHLRVQRGSALALPEVPGLTIVTLRFGLHAAGAGERRALWRRLHGRLPPGGQLVLADVLLSLPPGDIEDLDAWLAPVGGRPLQARAVAEELQEAGFHPLVDVLHPALAVITASRLGRPGS